MDFLATMPLVNLIIFLVAIVLIVVLIVIALRNKKIKIGNTEISEKEKQVVKSTRVSERAIIKKQIHISRAVCANFKCKVPHYMNYSEAEIENICFKVADEIDDLILFNHITNDDEYINSRFQLIWAVIHTNLNTNFTEKDTEDLQKTVYENFRKLIGILLNIREERE